MVKKIVSTKSQNKKFTNSQLKNYPLHRASSRTISAFSIIVAIIIISFVIAGIIFIQSLNKNTDTKSLIAQLSQYDFAVKQFYRKYNFLPGDTTSTVAFGLSENDTDGNGNGIIEDKFGNINGASGEITNFWLHLSKSKFINHNFDGAQNENAILGNTFPQSKININAGITIFGEDGKNYYQIGALQGDAENMIMADASITPLEAFDIDNKIDDGAPKTGLVRSAGGIVVNGIDNDGKCVSSEQKYKTQFNGILCSLRVDMGFGK